MIVPGRLVHFDVSDFFSALSVSNWRRLYVARTSDDVTYIDVNKQGRLEIKMSPYFTVKNDESFAYAKVIAP